MKIEILFPEFCNLFGDMSNMRYLQKCLPDAEFIETPFDSEPAFLTEPISLVYLGPMTERTQERVIKKFVPHREKIKQLIDSGMVFLFTGNAMEVLFTAIYTPTCRQVEKLNLSPIPLPKLKKEKPCPMTEIPALGLLPITAKRDMLHRHNSTFLGSFSGDEIMGFKSQFTLAYPQADVNGLFNVKKGTGLNNGCSFEGVRVNNFFGTYLLGPILVLNPNFTRHLLSCMGVENPQLAFEAAAEVAYSVRLKDFKEKT